MIKKALENMRYLCTELSFTAAIAVWLMATRHAYRLITTEPTFWGNVCAGFESTASALFVYLMSNELLTRRRRYLAQTTAISILLTITRLQDVIDREGTITIFDLTQCDNKKGVVTVTHKEQQ